MGPCAFVWRWQRSLFRHEGANSGRECTGCEEQAGSSNSAVIPAHVQRARGDRGGVTGGNAAHFWCFSVLRDCWSGRGPRSKRKSPLNDADNDSLIHLLRASKRRPCHSASPCGAAHPAVHHIHTHTHTRAPERKRWCEKKQKKL